MVVIVLIELCSLFKKVALGLSYGSFDKLPSGAFSILPGKTVKYCKALGKLGNIVDKTLVSF